ncbi:hypothetical protein HHI36_017721 [Cryptolaemus montrouzieri]|uniref:Uncharacterized protein n=1 Tax=Cryptolaemus montrouzieri TaxID=559131 RepID=A0ABD2NNL6_9CUCU
MDLSTLFLCFLTITCLHCAIIGDIKPNRHVHNTIHKEDEAKDTTIAEFPIDSHSKIVAVRPPNHAVESTTQVKTPFKVTIPLVHEHAKKLSSIKHPLPPKWHDLLPKETPSVIDQDKAHLEFLQHEGPNLQRRLHHHFLVEELRKRRQELKERLQARHNKFVHTTPQNDDEHADTLKLSPPSSHHIIGKQLEDTTLYPLSTTKHFHLLGEKSKFTTKKFQEMNELNGNAKTILPEPKLTSSSTTKTTITEPTLEIKHILEQITNEPNMYTTSMETSTHPNLISILRQKHRFSLPKTHVTIPSPEPPTTTKEYDIPQIKFMLSSNRHLAIPTETPNTTVRDEIATIRISAETPPIVVIENDQLTTTEIPNIDAKSEEHQMYQDWREHLKEAIKRRLHKFRHTQDQ